MAATFTVVRSTSIDAPPTAVYRSLIDFHEWEKWSPWEDPEVEMSRDYGGPDSGVGASYTWLVLPNKGSGMMRIDDAHEHDRGRVHVEFRKPQAMTFDIDFTLTDRDGRTDVEWSLVGKHSLLTRAAGATGLLDKGIGKELDRGLNNLKTVVENGS